jgi:hypothetical protein
MELCECQIPGLPRISEGPAELEPQPVVKRLKRFLAKPWNYQVKPLLKTWSRRLTHVQSRVAGKSEAASAPSFNAGATALQAGDLVRVRSAPEIAATLDRWKELKGCAFLEYMWPYCGTTQRVLKLMTRFLDERDYRVKKCKGIVLLEGVICHGTPVFGPCDRCCHLFWREEWLERIIEEKPIAPWMQR